MSIELSLPRVAATLDPEVEVRAVYVEEWIDSLAYANPPALLAETCASMERLNEQPLRPALRIELADLHVRPYAFALALRRNDGIAASATALARQRDLSRHLRLTARALALGYKQATSDLLSRARRFSAARDLRTALQRAILFVSQELLHCYDEYLPCIPGGWKELMALRSAALELGGAPAHCPVEDAMFSARADECFKRLCLTSLVDPYHLGNGDLWQVFTVFCELAERVRIAPIAPAARPAGLFVVDPQRDAKPRSLAQSRGEHGAGCLLLDVNPVLEALRARDRHSHRDRALPNHMRAAMVRALGLPPRRHAPRDPSEGRVRVAVGLSSVHHFVSGGAARIALPTAASDGDDIEIGDATGVAQLEGPRYRHERWEITDEGPAGIGIRRATWPEAPLGVGELVALQFPLRGDSAHDWTLGVVRWLQIDAEDTHRAGVQFLGERARSVMISLDEVSDTITRIPRPGLALPEIAPRPDCTLITPRGMFRAGNKLQVQTSGESWLLRAKSLHESTSAFERFTYEIIHG